MAGVKTKGVTAGFHVPPKRKLGEDGKPLPVPPKVIRLKLPRNYEAIPGGFLIRERA